jgi:hypothetical protein
MRNPQPTAEDSTMGCLIAEIASLIFGIITLATGKFRLTRTKAVYGTPPRVVGLLLVLILPCALGLAIAVAAVLVAMGELRDPLHPPAVLYAVEPITFLVFFTAAMIVAFANAGEPARRRPYPDEDFGEDDEFEHRLERERRPPDEELPR